MSIVNKALLIGRIGHDAEIRSIKGGQGKMASFTLATDDGYRNKATGEWIDQADWHRIVTYQTALIDALAHKLVKGRLLAIEGIIKTRKFTDQNGQARWTTEIIVDHQGTIRILDRPKEESEYHALDEPRSEHDAERVVIYEADDPACDSPDEAG